MTRTFTSLLVSLAIPMSSLAFVGCKKDEPPPPLPAAAAPAPEPSPVLAIEPVPEALPDAGGPAKKVGGGVAASSNLQACCNALAQNANSAPEPNATYMKQAAATCGVLAAQGKDKGSLMAVISGMLKGAGMPAACK